MRLKMPSDSFPNCRMQYFQSLTRHICSGQKQNSFFFIQFQLKRALPDNLNRQLPNCLLPEGSPTFALPHGHPNWLATKLRQLFARF
jgi:hypothetical protein